MKPLLAFFMLNFHFLKAATLSGLVTAKLILLRPEQINSGTCSMPYDGLDGFPLVILGMMITLTPGTTLIEIDRQNQTMTLHLLDLDDQAILFEQIEQDYIRYLKLWSGAQHDPD